MLDSPALMPTPVSIHHAYNLVDRGPPMRYLRQALVDQPIQAFFLVTINDYVFLTLTPGGLENPRFGCYGMLILTSGGCPADKAAQPKYYNEP